MSSRQSNHLSIDTILATAAARRTLPSPLSSTSSLSPCPPEEEMITTATLSHPPTLSIPSVPYPPNYSQHQDQLRQRHRSRSGDGRPWAEAGQGVNTNRRPSLPVDY